ncbi:hypothetical protein E2C01_002301 [Portunus trituberculatus]|uniref:Uncharacterized protein n=1 Tax=Portunus trituberculatus TaxID=210409 RepID=A0A5B7CLX1_PORTR|nr:hypothetical protein [Portunus trituberculatus]
MAQKLPGIFYYVNKHKSSTDDVRNDASTYSSWCVCGAARPLREWRWRSLIRSHNESTRCSQTFLA